MGQAFLSDIGPDREIASFLKIVPDNPNFLIFSFSHHRPKSRFWLHMGYKSSLDPKEIKNKEKGGRKPILKSKSLILKLIWVVSGLKRTQILVIFSKKTLWSITSSVKNTAPWYHCGFHHQNLHISASGPGNSSKIDSRNMLLLLLQL